MNALPWPYHRPQVFWVACLLLGVVGVRAFIYYRDQAALPAVLLLLSAFALLYFLEPALAARGNRLAHLCYLLQTGILLALSWQRPFLDFIQVLYILLGRQALRAFPFRTAMVWFALFAVCLSLPLIIATGWLEGLAFSLVVMAGCAFLCSYDRLSAQMERDRDESQHLLAALQQAHGQLKEHAVQAEALAAARERNRLARELHDSASQTIFAITLTSQTARLLLERDPGRVPEQLDRLQILTAAALSQLRSLIAQLRPPPTG